MSARQWPGPHAPPPGGAVRVHHRGVTAVESDDRRPIRAKPCELWPQLEPGAPVAVDVGQDRHVELPIEQPGERPLTVDLDLGQQAIEREAAPVESAAAL